MSPTWTGLRSLEVSRLALLVWSIPTERLGTCRRPQLLWDALDPLSKPTADPSRSLIVLKERRLPGKPKGVTRRDRVATSCSSRGQLTCVGGGLARFCGSQWLANLNNSGGSRILGLCLVVWYLTLGQLGWVFSGPECELQ